MFDARHHWVTIQLNLNIIYTISVFFRVYCIYRDQIACREKKIIKSNGQEDNIIFVIITHIAKLDKEICIKLFNKLQKWKLLQRHISKRTHTQKYISTGYLLKLHFYVDTLHIVNFHASVTIIFGVNRFNKEFHI